MRERERERHTERERGGGGGMMETTMGRPWATGLRRVGWVYRDGPHLVRTLSLKLGHLLVELGHLGVLLRFLLQLLGCLRRLRAFGARRSAAAIHHAVRHSPGPQRPAQSVPTACHVHEELPNSRE